jgi:hypothetical protein
MKQIQRRTNCYILAFPLSYVTLMLPAGFHVAKASTLAATTPPPPYGTPRLLDPGLMNREGLALLSVPLCLDCGELGYLAPNDFLGNGRCTEVPHTGTQRPGYSSQVKFQRHHHIFINTTFPIVH